LFHAALQHFITQTLEEARAPWARADWSLEQRLLDGFEALHGKTLEDVPRERTEELLAAAAYGSELVAHLERELVGAVANFLSRSGVAGRWGKLDVSAKRLAEQLFAAADGLQRLSEARASYRARMRIAIRIVVKDA
jgi:hypothetical protein